jgi:uncharacterized protein (DUF697 family)
MKDDNNGDLAARPPFSPIIRRALARADQTQVEARGIIKSHMIGAMSVGFIPVPIVDGIALTDIQWNLICRLADHYGVPIQAAYRTLLISAISGSLPVLFTGVGCWLIKLIPGFGHIAGTAALANFGAAVTYATGTVFMEHFENGGTMRDFSTRELGRQLRLEFRRGKRATEQLHNGQEI